MKIQKIIMKVWQFISPFFVSKEKCFGMSIEHKNGDSHTIVKTLYCEGKDTIESLKDTHLTYLK